MILRSRNQRVFLVFCVICPTLVLNASITCPKNYFKCDGQQCIPDRWVCDGSPDCRDNTDESEVNCPNRGISETCADDHFLCKSGICIPSTWKCDGSKDCPDGSDEGSALCKLNCTATEFTCKDGQCIDLRWKCNGFADCADKSDEENCTSSATTSFRCAGDSFKIPIRWVCDGENDCRDGSDETDCEGSATSSPPSQPSCRSSEFMCPNAFCIPQKWVCDGVKECLNGEDEMDCPPRDCISSEHRCGDGTCIQYSNRCDGQPDCPDGSDELQCTTTSTTTTTTTTTPTPKSSTSETADKEVEEETKTKVCDPETHFICKNELCIPKEKLCDGKMDCSQNEDESPEQCGVDECARNNGACMHKCVNTRQGYHCECNKGYRLVGKYNCEDIDECKEIPGVCSQQCNNTIGHYHCSCLPGYRRDPANYTRCKAEHGEVFLLFSHSFDIRQLRLRDRDMTSIVEDTRSAIALDYVFSDRQILWSDNKEKKIYRANLTNTMERQVLVSHEEVSADGLAVDWVHKNVYYTNSKKDAVFLLSWDGQWVKTIIKEDVGSPRAIAISPYRGSIFWTDWGTEAKIERASLDGSNRVAIVSNPQHVKWPNGLTIDHPTERLYWCDGYLRTIFAADIDGSNIEVILHSPSVLNHPFSISVFEDRIYWTDWSRVALFSADKFTGGEIVNVSAGHLLEAPKVVHVFHEYRQPKLDNICATVPCQHFCVRDARGEPTCVCADGYVLDTDQNSCIEEVLTTTTTPTPEPESTDAEVIPTTGGDKNTPPKEKLLHDPVDIYREGERTSQVGFILGGVFGAAVVVAAVIALYVVYMRTSRRTIKRIRFHNPVYKKTTIEDDERGYVIDQEEFFNRHSSGYHPESILVDADDVPLAPKDETEE